MFDPLHWLRSNQKIKSRRQIAKHVGELLPKVLANTLEQRQWFLGRYMISALKNAQKRDHSRPRLHFHIVFISNYTTNSSDKSIFLRNLHKLHKFYVWACSTIPWYHNAGKGKNILGLLRTLHIWLPYLSTIIRSCFSS